MYAFCCLLQAMTDIWLTQVHLRESRSYAESAAIIISVGYHLFLYSGKPFSFISSIDVMVRNLGRLYINEMVQICLLGKLVRNLGRLYINEMVLICLLAKLVRNLGRLYINETVLMCVHAKLVRNLGRLSINEMVLICLLVKPRRQSVSSIIEQTVAFVSF